LREGNRRGGGRRSERNRWLSLLPFLKQAEGETLDAKVGLGAGRELVQSIVSDSIYDSNFLTTMKKNTSMIR